MGGAGTGALASAVAAAGGFGMVTSWTVPSGGACGVNFLMPFSPSLERIEAAAEQARAVEFFYADPGREVVAAAHRGGALAGWQVGSADEAAAAVDAGCDYVAAQGIEAGGHVRGTQPLDQLLHEVLSAVQIPVVAAGGVATAEHFATVMSAGADAVRIGTRFIVALESAAHPGWVQKVLAATTGDDTVLTEWFGAGWEHAPHRVLRSSFDAAQKTGWRSSEPPTKETERDVTDMAMYAGMGVGDVNEIQSAADIVRDLVRLL
jgi:nitronate monooxygenase